MNLKISVSVYKDEKVSLPSWLNATELNRERKAYPFHLLRGSKHFKSRDETVRHNLGLRFEALKTRRCKNLQTGVNHSLLEQISEAFMRKT